MKKLKSIAIITARGGSKRIPGKNLRLFCGEPIIAYSIKAALEADVFDKVMVSTDSEEIKRISVQYGAEVPFMRSKENADDYATTADVLCEVLDSYRQVGIEFEYICCIYPTAPFITGEKLKKSMTILYSNDGIDSVAPVVKYSFPPQRAFVIKDDEINIMHPDTFQMRSQDFEPIFHDCGQYYCMHTSSFLEHKRLVLSHTYAVVVPELEVQDIDSEEDWEIAELKYQKMKNKKKYC